MNIPFVSFEKMHKEIESDITESFLSMYRNNIFIMGEQLAAFEMNLLSSADADMPLDAEPVWMHYILF